MNDAYQWCLWDSDSHVRMWHKSKHLYWNVIFCNRDMYSSYGSLKQCQLISSGDSWKFEVHREGGSTELAGGKPWRDILDGGFSTYTYTRRDRACGSCKKLLLFSWKLAKRVCRKMDKVVKNLLKKKLAEEFGIYPVRNYGPLKKFLKGHNFINLHLREKKLVLLAV